MIFFTNTTNCTNSLLLSLAYAGLSIPTQIRGTPFDIQGGMEVFWKKKLHLLLRLKKLH